MDFIYIVVQSEAYDAVDVGLFREEELKEAIKFAVKLSRDEKIKEENGDLTYYIYKVKFGELPVRREECVGMFECGERI